MSILSLLCCSFHLLSAGDSTGVRGSAWGRHPEEPQATSPRDFIKQEHECEGEEKAAQRVRKASPRGLSSAFFQHFLRLWCLFGTQQLQEISCSIKKGNYWCWREKKEVVIDIKWFMYTGVYNSAKSWGSLCFTFFCEFLRTKAKKGIKNSWKDLFRYNYGGFCTNFKMSLIVI